MKAIKPDDMMKFLLTHTCVYIHHTYIRTQMSTNRMLLYVLKDAEKKVICPFQAFVSVNIWKKLYVNTQ